MQFQNVLFLAIQQLFISDYPFFIFPKRPIWIFIMMPLYNSIIRIDISANFLFNYFLRQHFLLQQFVIGVYLLIPLVTFNKINIFPQRERFWVNNISVVLIWLKDFDFVVAVFDFAVVTFIFLGEGIEAGF